MVKKVLNESFNRTLLINKFKKTEFKIRKMTVIILIF